MAAQCLRGRFASSSPGGAVTTVSFMAAKAGIIAQRWTPEVQAEEGFDLGVGHAYDGLFVHAVTIGD
jgi:hypothetical protein